MPEENKKEDTHPIDKFNEWLRNNCKQGMIYRGLKDSRSDIEASLYRRLENKEYQYSRKNMSKFIEASDELLEKAKREGYHQEDGKEMKNLELLAKLQHMGAATCLIDFTDNPFVALWFACQFVTKEQAEKEIDGKLYTGGKVVALNIIPGFNSERFNFPKKIITVNSKHWGEKIETFLSTGQLWKWSPPKQNPRIIAQQSVFILGKGIIRNKEIDEIHSVPKEAKMDIIKELKKQGVSERSLFCDFSGFVQQNSWEKSRPDLTPDDYLDLAMEELQSDNFEKAIQYCIKSLDIEPRNANAYCTLGFIEGQARNFYGAIDHFNTAIEICKRHYDAHCFRGAAKAETGDYDGAIEDYNEARDINPNSAEVYYHRGFIYHQLGNREKADKDYHKTKELEPDNLRFPPYDEITPPQN